MSRLPSLWHKSFSEFTLRPEVLLPIPTIWTVWTSVRWLLLLPRSLPEVQRWSRSKKKRSALPLRRNGLRLRRRPPCPTKKNASSGQWPRLCIGSRFPGCKCLAMMTTTGSVRGCCQPSMTMTTTISRNAQLRTATFQTMTTMSLSPRECHPRGEVALRRRQQRPNWMMRMRSKTMRPSQL